MFRLAPTGFLGNAGRGTLRGPGLSTWDLSLNKDTALPFLESAKLQFRAEIFNVLNHANFVHSGLHRPRLRRRADGPGRCVGSSDSQRGDDHNDCDLLAANSASAEGHLLTEC